MKKAIFAVAILALGVYLASRHRAEPSRSAEATVWQAIRSRQNSKPQI